MSHSLVEINDFLSDYLKSFSVIFNNEIAAVKACNFKYLSVTPLFLTEILCKTSSEEVIGFDNQELNKFMIADDSIHDADANVIETKQSKFHLSVNEFDKQIKMFMVERSPILYCTNLSKEDIVVGIRLTCKPVHFPNLFKLISYSNGKRFNYQQTNCDEIINSLSIKQRLILFLYLNSYSNSDISFLLSIADIEMSVNAVDKHLSKLKEILDVKNKNQFIEKALTNNLQRYIPRQLFKYGLFELEMDQLTIV